MSVALSVRTYFSLKESIINPLNIGQLAKDNGYDAVAITDNMNINGLVDLTKSCKKAGVKPIIGCRLAVYDDPSFKQTKAEAKISVAPNVFWSPKVYAKNEAGMKGIIQLLARANQDDYFYYTPRIGLTEVIDLLKTGDIVLVSGDLYGLFSHKQYADIATKIIGACSVSDFYIEIVPIDTPLYDKINQSAYDFAKANELEMVATLPFFYEYDEDVESKDIMTNVISQNVLSSPFRANSYLRGQSFKPEQVLDDAVGALSDRIGMNAIDQSMMMTTPQEIADKCTYEWKELPISLPILAEDESAALAELIREGWKQRLGSPVLGYMPNSADLPIYKERLQYELGVLRKMGFERYFLLVSDLVRWAKSEDIQVGCGRGSAAGSLISYLLKITDVDPIRFNLIFERFINPERIDLPDIDLDFASSRRHEIIEYAKERFGEECVAGISNYVTLGSASAIRDIGKVFELHPFDMTCTKLMPKEHGEMMDIDVAAEMVPEIDKFKRGHPEVWGHAQKLVGTLRNYGKHAAGVVIAGEPIRNRAVLERRSGQYVVNWDRNSVEKWGLIKVDVLGLSTLDIIDIAIKSIKERLGVTVNPLKISLEDDLTLKAFSEGKGIGIFQFDGGGVRALLKDLAKKGQLTFDDVSAATALYRPGPMDAGLMKDYVNFKQGADATYDHPNMKAALEPTGGVLIYQEQTMQIARDVAGFTMAEADVLRKIIGKKQKDEMALMRDKFVQGCIDHSVMTDYQANKLFDTIEKFAGYGFNKSHSVSYAIISYTAMYLKTHYPLDFFAASMSILDEDKMPSLVSDANTHGIEIYPPDINISTDKFEVGADHAGEQILIIPFNRVKGISSLSALGLVEAREALGGSFKSVEEFRANVTSRRCNSRVMDSLDKVGAFAHIQVNALPPRHPDRLKDQLELLPGLSSSHVSVTRKMLRTPETLKGITKLYSGLAKCADCSLAGGAHPTPIFGRKAEFMVITDCPTKNEDSVGKMLSGDGADFIKYSLQETGLKAANGYFTTLVKSIKNGRKLTNEQINGCSQYLDHEIKLLTPAVIVLMGSDTIKRFLPAEKKPNEVRCKVVYSKEYDANFVVGMNPALLWFDVSRQDEMTEIFQVVADLINN
jgi:DNA polymerase-3 subunit alpha